MTVIDDPPDFGIDREAEPPFTDLFPPPVPPADEELDSWAPVDLTTLPDKPPVMPTLGASTGVGLVYPGKRHVFSGPPESAKTIAAYAIGLQVVRDGGRVILIDFEMGAYDARSRLQDLGATTHELSRILYLEPNDPATPQRIDRLIALQPQLVTIDAAAGVYDLQGLDDNKRQDVEQVARLYTNAFWRAGIATIFVDHVVKNTETRGKFVIGSERKLGGADVHIGFETITPISRGTKGLYKILTHKDRGGYLKRGHLANLDLSSDPDTHSIAWQFKTVEDETTETGGFRPTHLMEKVSLHLETQPGPVSRSSIIDAVKSNRNYVTAAIDALVLEDYAAQTDGPRNAKLITSLRPYREQNEPAVPPVSTCIEPYRDTDDATCIDLYPPLTGGDSVSGRRPPAETSRAVSDDDPDADLEFR